MDSEKIAKLKRLKKEKNAVILAHYYISEEVQEVADYVGDSFFLSKLATKIPETTICYAGVKFMAESAKILNPDKTVLMPDFDADCPMAHMATVEKVKEMKEKIEDLAVVCYINSTTQLKCVSDVCVTSANAVKIVKNLKQKNIFFIPDKNLGNYVAKQVPEKNFFFNDGYCPIHNFISLQSVQGFKLKNPNAKVLAHPECPENILNEADFVGSTSMIIDYAEKSCENEFLILTENGIAFELKNKLNGKKFSFVEDDKCCEDMKKITIDKVIDVLENNTNEVFVDEKTREMALIPLERMLEMAK